MRKRIRTQLKVGLFSLPLWMGCNQSVPTEQARVGAYQAEIAPAPQSGSSVPQPLPILDILSSQSMPINLSPSIVETIPITTTTIESEMPPPEELFLTDAVEDLSPTPVSSSPPEFVSWTPSSGRVGILPSILITFNKPIQLQTGQSALTAYGCATGPTISASLNSDATQLTGTLSGSGCKPGDTYTVTLNSTAISDASGNTLTNPPGAYAYTIRSFISVGSMSDKRQYHTATRLNDGRVLVAGGYGPARGSSTEYTVFNTAEIYDPTKKTFSQTTGLMQTGRAWHTAILLPNGKVWITGGSGLDSAISTTEFYDPSTDKFTAAGAKANFTGGGHTLTLLSSGLVLVAGGNSTSAQLYDYKSNTFAKTATMTAAKPRQGHVATLLQDGTVLITGGVWPNPETHMSGGTFDSAELYHPDTNTFTAITSHMATPRFSHSAQLLPDGTVLITGTDNRHPLPRNPTTAELYDPKTQLFTTITSMPSGPEGSTSAALSDGTVIILGGYDWGDFDSNGIPRNAIPKLYDPVAKNFFHSISSMVPIAYRLLHTSTLLLDGSMLNVGGATSFTDSYSNTADLYQ